MTTPSTGRHRTRTVLLVVAFAVLVGVIVGLVVVLATKRGTSGSAPATTTVAPTSSTASSTADSSTATQLQSTPSLIFTGTGRPSDDLAGSLADGCLGGQDPHAAVLAASKEGTADNLGAAAFARTFARWSLLYPSDPDAQTVFNAITVPDSGFPGPNAITQAKATDAKLKAADYISSRIVPNKGRYRIISPLVGSQQIADVQIQVYRELTKASGETSEAEFTNEFLFQRVDGTWHVYGKSGFQKDPNDTSIAWQPYTGAC